MRNWGACSIGVRSLVLKFSSAITALENPMPSVVRTVAVVVAFLLSGPTVHAQAAGGGADFNKADRERVKRQEAAQQRRNQCMRTCDTSFRGSYAICGGYPPTAQGTCTLNVQKNQAKCYAETCK